MSYSYDDNCEDLARHFLSDLTVTEQEAKKLVQELSQAIQNAIEDWFVERDQAAHHERS